MPKLVLSMDGLVLKEIVLTKERTTIGRKSFNDIQLDNLAISGEHAVITTILDDAFLEDRNSTNGTYVNGHSVKKHALRSNDVIELGKYRLKFISEQSMPKGTAPGDMIDSGDLGQGGVAGKVDDDSDGVGQASSVVPPLVGADQAELNVSVTGLDKGVTGVIQILSGTNAGKELLLTRSLTTLGKPGVQVAVITRRPDGYFITHVEGPRTSVSGVSLDDQARRLTEHDIIELGGVKMEFFLRS